MNFLNRPRATTIGQCLRDTATGCAIGLLIFIGFVRIFAAGAPSYTLPTTADTSLTTGSVTLVPTLGAELAPSLIEANWTHGGGWENPIVGPGLIKTIDGTGTQTPTAATNILAAATYKVVITLSANSAGTATYTLGATAGTSTLNSVATFTDYVTTTTTGKLIITPTNTSRMTISAISVKQVTLGGIVGTTTNDLAVPGAVGEIFTSKVAVGAAVTLTTSNTVYDITSVALTAGSWMVSGNINLASSGGTITAEIGGFNTTTASLPVDGSEVNSGILTTAVSDTDGITLPVKVFLLSAPATVYMSAKVTKAAGTITGYGAMTCIRFR